jgi:nucleoside-diphosphate-sugar epimerase
MLQCVKRLDSLFNTARIDRLVEAPVFNAERLAELGWQYAVDLELGLERTYRWFLKNQSSLRGLLIYY